jgi:hypothetical protein
MTTTFFTACNRAYEPFIAPYAASILLHNDDALVEICVEDPERFSQTQVAAVSAILRHFPDRFYIRSGSFADIRPGSVRFLETPRHMSEYTYIGDVDILVLDRDITAMHRNRMKRTGLPYSNIVRDGTERLSGLHFTRSDSYYPVRIPEGADLQDLDEELLFQLVAARDIGLPAADHRWRPVHGIHISLNRAPYRSHVDNRPDWGVRDHYLTPYLSLWSNAAWLDVAPHFHPAYQVALLILEAAIQARHPELDVYRSPVARELWRHLALEPSDRQ